MRSRRRRSRRAFTILDMALAILLMMVLALLIAHSWAAFGRSALIAVARARLAQEASLVAEALTRDVGRLARFDGGGSSATQTNIKMDGSALTLWVDDGTDLVRTVIYETDADDPGLLFRSEAGQRRVVAALVSDFQGRATTRPSGSGGQEVPGVEVELTLSHRAFDRDPDGTFRDDYTRRYLLFIEGDPS